MIDPSTIEALARRMCAAAGENPDRLERIQTSGARWSLSGLLARPQYESRPRWRHYEREARNALVTLAYQEETPCS